MSVLEAVFGMKDLLSSVTSNNLSAAEPHWCADTATKDKRSLDDPSRLNSTWPGRRNLYNLSIGVRALILIQDNPATIFTIAKYRSRA
jgi:hypothetical protein